MKGKLRISLRADDDKTAELFFDVQAGAFSGRSSAWFNLSVLGEQIKTFSAYPLSAEDPPIIRGGYWNKDVTEIEQEHVFLSALPRGATGEVVLLVRLAISDVSLESREVLYSVSVKLVTCYEQLNSFVRDFDCLIKGEATHLELDEAF